jgi:hypothetical protein
MANDTERGQRWLGAELDLARPLTSMTILEAAPADPRILEHAPGYLAMTALPGTLEPAEPLARAVYESGWRPPFAAGPSRDELAALMSETGAALAS